MIKRWLYHIPHTCFDDDPEARVSWEDIWLTPEDDEDRDFVFEGEEVNSFWLTLESSGIVLRDLCDTDEEYQKDLEEYLRSIGNRSHYLDMNTGVIRIPFDDFNKEELLGWAKVFLKKVGFPDVILTETSYEDFPGVNEQIAMIEELQRRLEEGVELVDDPSFDDEDDAMMDLLKFFFGPDLEEEGEE